MDRLLGYRDAEGTNGRAFLLSQERKAARTSDHAEELPSVYLCSFSANANSIETSLGLLSFYGEDQITPLSAVLNYLPRRNVMSHYRKFPRVEIYRICSSLLIEWVALWVYTRDQSLDGGPA